MKVLVTVQVGDQTATWDLADDRQIRRCGYSIIEEPTREAIERQAKSFKREGTRYLDLQLLHQGKGYQPLWGEREITKLPTDE